jgi:hypothetical protein
MNTKFSAQTAALLLAALVSGCSTFNPHTSVSWQAKVDTVPSAECVKGAIAVTYNTMLADYNHSQAGDHYLIKLQRSDTVLDLSFSQLQNEPTTFALGYGYSKRSNWANNTVAHALITAISQRCGVPELARRARRTYSGQGDLGPLNI